MVIERSKERRDKRDSKDDYANRDTRGKRSFRDSPRRRDSGRGFNSYSRDKRDVEMTKVTCSSCGAECEVPFKPTSNKPVYCNDCFAKKDKFGSNKPSNKDLDIINEKLDKIIKALKIE